MTPYELSDQQKQHLRAKLTAGAAPTSYAHYLIRIWEPVDPYTPGEVEGFLTAVNAFAAGLEDRP